MKSSFPVILFFINGAHPTADDLEEAESYGPNVRFRNAHHVAADMNPGAIESCDGVAGTVPKAYQKFPSAEDAITAFNAARQAARQKLAANAAGTPPSAPQAPGNSEPQPVEEKAAAPAKNEAAAAGWTANK